MGQSSQQKEPFPKKRWFGIESILGRCPMAMSALGRSLRKPTVSGEAEVCQVAFSTGSKIYQLVGGLEHQFYFPIYLE